MLRFLFFSFSDIVCADSFVRYITLLFDVTVASFDCFCWAIPLLFPNSFPLENQLFFDKKDYEIYSIFSPSAQF